MNVGRFILAGIAASVLFLVLDMVLGMVGGLAGRKLFGLSVTQPPGMDKKVRWAMGFEVINGLMLALIYALIREGLPGQGWVKGLSYGLVVWGLRVVMWAFSTYVMTDLPPIQIGINVVTGLIEVLILGVVIAVIYGPGG